MRIDGWHIDGFGILKDFDQADFRPGVTVLLGENETGKSTLLAFVRMMLFGFPDGRSKELTYAPVRGGRHGGRLILRDRDEQRWIVERYADDRKVLGLMRPDGSAGDPAELAALLGGADAQLFKSVFAFGLDELQAIESLSAEGVGSRIFDAGISGAGKSAREVMRRLEQRKEDLLKLRRGEAKINNIVRELIGIDEQERAARELVGRYEQLQLEEREQSSLAEQLREEGETLLRRKADLDALVELRPQWEDLEEKRLQLQELPQVADETLPDQVSGLLKDLEGQRAREEGLPDLETTSAKEKGALDSALDRLGLDWDVGRAKAFDTSLTVEDEVRGWGEKLDAAAAALRAAELQRKHADEESGRLQALAERSHVASPKEEPLTLEEIDRRESLLRTLREDLSGLETLRLKAEQHQPAPVVKSLPVLVLAGLAAIGCAAAFVLGYTQLGVGLAVAAVLLGIVAALLRRGESGSAGGPTEQSQVVKAAAASLVAVARDLGLPESPSSRDMSDLEARLRSERTRRADWDNAQARVREADENADEARRVLGVAVETERASHDELQGIMADWSVGLEHRGLTELSPNGVATLLQRVNEAVAADDRLATAIRAIAAVEDKAQAWDVSARSILAAAGRSSGGLSAEGLRAAVESLNTDMIKRANLAATVDSLEGAISVRIGSCVDHVAAADELACGSLDVWNEELAVLLDDIKRTREERDAAIKAATSASDERRRIEESADIPRLQEERESLRAELADLAHEYRVVSTANALIADTLKTYVRERQPAVLEAGSTALQRVTGGRYVRVQQDDAGALESVIVVAGSGEQLKPEILSKGTQQQLYLAIRLALVEEFGKRTEPLPMIMDDCLVNFDPKRAAAVAGLLAERSADGQCLIFTCHPETADLMARQTAGPVSVIDMPRLLG